jgi:RNA polymerase sigma-70 factor (ECF subfamily)
MLDQDKLSHKNDLALAKALVKGDERQFTVFFDEYFPRLYRFAYTRLGSDEELVKDIVQSTLMNSMRYIDSYRGDAAMFTWLCQICRNEIAGYYRKLSRSVPEVAADDEAIKPILESLEAGEEVSPDIQFESREAKQLIQEVLDFLPGNYGNALEWKYIHGFSVTEIAGKLEVSELAVQSLLARARTSFRAAVFKISPQLATGREN